MSEYIWEWQQGDGDHIWLRDFSGRLAQERNNNSSSVGYIEPTKDGWLIASWNPHKEIATLPDTMTKDEVMTVAKTILLSLKEST